MADSKSVGGFSADSSWDSKSFSSSKSRSEAKRQRHMLKLKKRMENLPQRKLLFRPKVYESWKEGELEDEIAERERLLRDIAAKEQRLLERRRAKLNEGEGGEEEYSDSDEENQVIKALDRLKSRKQREEEYKTRLEEEQKRREEEKALELQEKLLSELQNPSVFGWFYTDGYYENIPYFGIREDLVPKMLEEQEQWAEKWTQKYPENFTDQFKRFFWPPKLICKGKTFRTRGSYLDFPEVIADWPKAVDVNFEKDTREYITNRHELFGVDEAQKEEDEKAIEEARLLEEAAAQGEITVEELEQRRATSALLKAKAVGSPYVFDLDTTGHNLDQNQWYYDDEEGQFFRKKLGFDVEYYHDGINHCWRHKKKRGKYKSENQQTPYDYYFDDSNRSFVPREDYKGLDEIVYDQKSAVYRIHLIGIGSKPQKQDRKTKSGTTLIDLPDLKDEGEGGKKLSKPSSYYFDEELGKWILKHELPENVNSTDISWDENGKRYSRKFEGPWRGLTGFSPDDYYWQDRTRKYIPKPARQAESFRYYAQDGVWRKNDEAGGIGSLHSEDVSRWYFDEFEGQFKPKDFTSGTNARYIQGRYSKIWRLVAPPKSNMYPEEFYYDRHKQRWLPRSVRLEMLKNAEVARQKNIMQATHGAGGLWDIKQNDKDTKPEDFYFDDVEGVFLKKRPNTTDEYVFDDQDKCWKLEKMKDRPKQNRYSHDYYFDVDEKNFLLKNPATDYNYDSKHHVWKKGNDDLSKVSPSPEDFCFDVTAQTWGKKEGGGIQFDPMLNISVKPSADPNNRSPDDYYFHEVDGRFYPKENEEALGGAYVYDAGDGAWRHKDVKGPSKSGLAPRNFFFDDNTKTFKLKVHGREKDYFFDKCNKIFRSIVASGKTKSGFKPGDFMWNNEFKNYIPLSVLKKSRVDAAVFDEMPKWDPLRQYNKPWMSAATTRNPDLPASTSREKLDDGKGGKGGGGGLFSTDRKKKNRVEPDPQGMPGSSPSSASGSVSSKAGTSKKGK